MKMEFWPKIYNAIYYINLYELIIIKLSYENLTTHLCFVFLSIVKNVE